MTRAHTPILLVNDFDQFLGGFAFRRKLDHQLPTADCDVFLVQRIKGLLAFFADIDQARIAQDRQVMRDGRLRETNLLHDLVHRQPTATTLAHDLLASLVRNGFGKQDWICFHRVEIISKFVYLSSLASIFVGVVGDNCYIHNFECVCYNIFRIMNMKKPSIPNLSEKLAAPLSAIASPQRIAILLAIGKGEACVCHLETALGWRQAYISQHLMALRKADILQDRREGRYVYYRLKNASYLDLILDSALLSGLSTEAVSAVINTQVYPSCECPHCVPAVIPVGSLTVKTSS